MESKILFKETQQFRQWWVWLIVLIVSGVIAYNIFEIIPKLEIGDYNKTQLNTGFVVILIFITTVLLLITIKLQTLVKEDGIYIKFFPFHLSFKKYKWERINKCFIREYKPISEFGGWGYRFGVAGKALNVSGNKGLQLEFTNNKRLLIGTNKPTELEDVLKGIEALKT